MKPQASDESVLRTMMIAVIVALVCSAMVSGVVFLLRPIQAAYAALERNQAILRTAGRLPVEVSEQALVAGFLDLDARVVELASGLFTKNLDGHVYDHWKTVDGDAGAVMEREGLPALAGYVPVYLVFDAARLERVVLPVHGQGMWSTLYGYLALDQDLRTIAGLNIYRHGETPGIGDRIQDPHWLQQWRGKQMYDSNGRVRLQVSSDQSIETQYRVDAISGATVSSEAVGAMIRFWVGPEGYQRLLQRLRQDLEASGHAGSRS